MWNIFVPKLISARLYQLNEKSPFVVLLKSIESTLIRDAADVAEEKAVMNVKANFRKNLPAIGNCEALYNSSAEIIRRK